ncbi:hypothetical protein BGW36DRAFT_185535 [Talaromyces proteolyticus]|uniref:Uncharacterized protein n=1 Tax=Talaromyces proteolyticus TaxID=1131652 RepID=A0AAD4PVB9_9EURO|nr:uncharacterized protein BGW36DRAFT_185535 [Talaromyces proteolyticus]KAH8696365.1 hypothetical protein BGW36DRAFT_185535 [Talaromyces proteolyticus]
MPLNSPQTSSPSSTSDPLAANPPIGINANTPLNLGGGRLVPPSDSARLLGVMLNYTSCPCGSASERLGSGPSRASRPPQRLPTPGSSGYTTPGGATLLHRHPERTSQPPAPLPRLRVVHRPRDHPSAGTAPGARGGTPASTGSPRTWGSQAMNWQTRWPRRPPDGALAPPLSGFAIKPLQSAVDWWSRESTPTAWKEDWQRSGSCSPR